LAALSSKSTRHIPAEIRKPARPLP